ncbi:hypothetical protein JCM8097_006282 [Rhodosporidiobolus ruineniae]
MTTSNATTTPPATVTPPPSHWQSALITLDPHSLPPLPPILSSTQANLARTHKSSQIDRAHGSASDNYLAELASNERLEWHGDALVRWLISDKLFKMLPYATSGFLTTIRDRLVSNRTFSHLSWHYGIVQSLITAPQPETGRRIAPSEEQKTAANAFEAYLGAVLASHTNPPDGIRALDTFLCSLLKPAVIPPLAALVEEFSHTPKEVVGEQRCRKRKLESVLGDAADSNFRARPSRTSATMSTHSWEENYQGGAGWKAAMQIKGEVVAVGMGAKLLDARDAALAAYLETLNGGDGGAEGGA